jgi:predicted phage tail protein
MQRTIGVICLVIGIVLLVEAHHMATAIESQLSQIATGEPTRRTTLFRIAGAALTIFGISQIFWPAKPK